jgi:hypothetical protein
MNTLNRLTVRAEVVGRRGMALAPLEIEQEFACETVRDLLAAIVREQVESFRRRKEASQLLRVLSKDNLQDGAAAGRVLSGAQEVDPRIPEVGDAIDVVLQAFVDGFFFMFLNGVQMDGLDQQVPPSEALDVLFVRLTPLVGG